MKKTLTAASFMAIFFLLTPMAFAGASTQTLGEVRVTLTVAGVPTANGDFIFDTSPNVSMAIATSNVAYAITVTNTLTKQDVGYEYGTNNTATGYAQRQKTVDPGVAVPAPADETEAFAGWDWMGGSGG